MADINAMDLTQETASTLDGNEQFVMFDSTEGKRALLSLISEYILDGFTFTDPNNDGNIVIERRSNTP